MNLYFSHGLESGPNSTKIEAMQAVVGEFDRVTATALDYRHTRDPKERLQQLESQLKQDGVAGRNVLLVGSSLGSWVSAALTERSPVRGCFLLAPAFGLPDYPESNPDVRADVVQVIHGWDDDVVPVGPVVNLCHRQRLPLQLVPDGHRLVNSMPTVLSQFRHWLRCCLNLDQPQPRA